MQILELAGTAYERGAMQGMEMRERARDMLDTFFSSEMWLDNRPAAIPQFVVNGALGFIGNRITRKAVMQHLPAQAQRTDGLADGLGMKRGFVWGLQFMEIMFCEAGKSLKAPGGCTQVHAQPHATTLGKPLIARNYDFPNLLRDFQTVRRMKPSEPDRLATLTVTQVASTGCHMGMNEAGLVVGANNARLWKGPDLVYTGSPYMLILNEILETCRTTAQAMEFLQQFPARANAGFFGMMDETGDDAIVEFTACRTMVRRPGPEGVLAQTNHYLNMTDANLPEGTYWTVKGMEGLEYATSSHKRYEAADRLIKQAAGSVTIETIQSILSDHSGDDPAGSDYTICCHGHSGSTLSGMVFDIAERTMWFAEGNPCQAKWVPVGLDASSDEKNKLKSTAV
jgi:hypothetical protein